ncbi:MAG: sigma 54-interacting transcriptional regulator [Ectothiorhodospiraceae bacterium]|jgi:DNA-binding NtrC family response regulator|nr:sigma 54-interacting transcriptional regulator [Ectothiorhodospiraceae bacterium]
MATELDLGSVYHLPSQLRLFFDYGRITLGEHRMIMLHTGAVGSLRKELIDTLGVDRARGVLTRMGFASGERDAELARKLMPHASDDELLMMGPRLHSLEGIVSVSPIRLDIDIANGRYHGEFLWTESYEAEIHLSNFGVHHEPVCWTQIGYAAGYTSAIMGRFILYREVECRGQGDRHCRILGKPLENWDDADGDMKYFRPDRVADQLLKLQAEVEHLRYSIDKDVAMGDMVGGSPAFLATCNLLKKAAESHVTVLLLGETGVGKEMCARALHGHSPRANNAFVAINCAAIPEELIESELFGVEKGAFTGAQHSRPGRFERAHGGTLFLDEVGELSAAAQAKLLRVLQEGEFERIGDTRTRKVDVRVVAATNVDLQQAVDQGKFRADLYYRLNIFPVVIPSLRDRRDDIALLVDRFLQKYSARHGKRISGITERALDALRKYDWPGNIRELENMIERGVIIAGSDQKIDIADLFPCINIGRKEPALLDEVCDTRDAGRGSGSLKDMVDHALDHSTSLEEIEVLMLQSAVDRANGNLSLAARSLGLTRPQLAYRLKKREADAGGTMA